MSYMFEVLYRSPPDPAREAGISDHVGRFGGRLTDREEPAGVGPVCLTYEFSDRDIADRAAESLRARGEHVEGPSDYGD